MNVEQLIGGEGMALAEVAKALEQYDQALNACRRAAEDKDNARLHAKRKVREAIHVGVSFEDIIAQHSYARSMVIGVLHDWCRELEG